MAVVLDDRLGFLLVLDRLGSCAGISQIELLERGVFLQSVVRNHQRIAGLGLSKPIRHEALRVSLRLRESVAEVVYEV